MATGGPRFQEIQAESWPIFHIRARPAFRPLIAAKDSLFTIPFSSCYHGGRKWGKLSNPYPRLWFWEGYIEMAMGGPSFQEIMVGNRAICQWRIRPALRPLIADKKSLFRIPFPSCFHRG